MLGTPLTIDPQASHERYLIFDEAGDQTSVPERIRAGEYVLIGETHLAKNIARKVSEPVGSYMVLLQVRTGLLISRTILDWDERHHLAAVLGFDALNERLSHGFDHPVRAQLTPGPRRDLVELALCESIPQAYTKAVLDGAEFSTTTFGLSAFLAAAMILCGRTWTIHDCEWSRTEIRSMTDIIADLKIV